MDTNTTLCLVYNSSTNQTVVLRLREEEIKERQGQVNMVIHKIESSHTIHYRSLRDKIFKMDTNSDICTVCKRSNNQTQVEAISQEEINARLAQAQTVMLIMQSRLTIHYRLLEGEQKYKAVLEVLWYACEHLQIRTGALKAHLQQIKLTSAEEISIFILTEHITNTSCELSTVSEELLRHITNTACQLSTVSEELLRLCYTRKIEELIKYIVKQDDFNELIEDVKHTILKFESFNKNYTEVRMNEEIERQLKMSRTIFCPLTVRRNP